MHTPDRTNERNCVTVIAEGIVILCMALILGGFCAWALFLSPEWMR